MTNYESIKAILDSGHWAEVCYLSDGATLFSVFRRIRPDGSLVRGPRYSCGNNPFDWDGESFCMTEEEINSIPTKSITPYPIKPPVLKVGDKVKVLVENDSTGDYAKLVFTIARVRDNDKGILYRLHNDNYQEDLWWPHYKVCKVWEDENKITQEMVDEVRRVRETEEKKACECCKVMHIISSNPMEDGICGLCGHDDSRPEFGSEWEVGEEEFERELSRRMWSQVKIKREVFEKVGETVIADKKVSLYIKEENNEEL
jgi:hypothetical protein